MGTTFDTCYLIDLVRGHPRAVDKAEQIESAGTESVITTPVLYEIMTGLLYRRSRTETDRLRRIISRFQIVPFDGPSSRSAAEIQTELLRLGRRSSDIDVMIAGIAVHHRHVLVTRDQNLIDLEAGVPLDVETY